MQTIPASEWVFLTIDLESGVEYTALDFTTNSRRRSRSPKAMLRRVTEGGICAVVVHKIDRLARSMEDHLAIRAALRHAGVQLVSVTSNIEETASGRLVEGIHALMAEFYSANLAGEIRKGMTQKAKMGGWPTKAPIGY